MNHPILKYLVILILLTNCAHLNTEIHGEYILKNSNKINIAEILELEKDSTFVFSGLNNESSFLITWVIEGEWSLKEDSIILNTKDHKRKDYGANINLSFLANYIDSVDYLEQGIMICRDMVFLFKDEKLYRIEKDKELIYQKSKQSR